jgi:hypothetical protein
MEVTAQTPRRLISLLWLAAGALLAALALFVGPEVVKAPRSEAVHATDAEQIAQLRQHVDRLEQQVQQFQGITERREAMQLQPTGSHDTPARSAPAPVTEPVPSPSEEELAEEVAQRVDKRYAWLEKRFADEPFESSTQAPEAQTIGERIRSLNGYELLKLDCHATMCRIEIKSDTASAGELLLQLGLKEGGEVRRRQDGTFLIFAGREGFPFQAINRVD